LTVGVAAQLDLPDLDARKWHFPKEFHAETTFDESKIYPQRAPDGGGAKGTTAGSRRANRRSRLPSSCTLLTP
jgi:hypothetical protein